LVERWSRDGGVPMTQCTQPAIMALLWAPQRNREVEGVMERGGGGGGDNDREGNIYVRAANLLFCF